MHGIGRPNDTSTYIRFLSCFPPPTPFLLNPSTHQQFVTRASSTVRAALKEPAKSKAMAQESFTYNSSKWAAGEQGDKVAVSALGKAGL